MPALAHPQKEALARELAAGAANARAACVAAGYSANTAASKGHLLVRDASVLARAQELRSMAETLGRQDIERRLRPVHEPAHQHQPAQQHEPKPDPDAERKAFYAQQHARDAERREREHQQRMREAEERERQRLASLPVPVAAKPGEAEPVLVRIDEGDRPDVRYAIPSTSEGLGSVADLSPDQMRAWLSTHLGAIAVEARVRGDRRAAISAADGLAKIHGLQTTKVDVTRKSVIDEMSPRAALQLLELLDMAERGEIEFVSCEVVEDEEMHDEAEGSAAVPLGEIETCTTVDDPLA